MVGLNVRYVLLHSIEKDQPGFGPCRLSIGIDILSRPCGLLNGSCFGLYWDCLFDVSLCVAVFGFLWCGEFTTNSCYTGSPVSVSDLILISTTATIFLQRSKSGRCNRGVVIRYFRTHNNFRLISSLYHLSGRVSSLNFFFPNPGCFNCNRRLNSWLFDQDSWLPVLHCISARPTRLYIDTCASSFCHSFHINPSIRSSCQISTSLELMSFSPTLFEKHDQRESGRPFIHVNEAWVDHGSILYFSFDEG
jgi:hypothetical protein